MKLPRFVRKYQVPLFFVLLAGSIGTIFAVQDLQQTVPSSPPIRAQVAVTSSSCASPATLTWGNTTSSSSTFLPVNPPAVLYCSGSVAFTTTRAGTDSATFTLPAPATSLAIDQTPSCAVSDASHQNVTSGLGLTLTGGGYYYCVAYPPQTSSGTTIGTFTISWAS